MSRLTRRDFVGTGLSAALLAPLIDLRAQRSEPIRKIIPSSGEALTAIGVGTNRYGVGSSASAREPLRETLRQFNRMGGQLIDTAEEYGNAEEVIGDLTQALEIGDQVFLATKVRMVGREAGLRSIEQSFRRLRRRQIDLIQVHDLIDVPTQLATLRELKAAGRIRYTGMTTAGDGQLADIERYLLREECDFVQISYSLEERGAAERLLPLAADRGVAVLVNRPLGRGRIFSSIGDRPLPDWAADFDCGSWAQFFLKYIISHPAVTCAIPGTRTEAHVLDNLGAAHGRLPDAALRARMERLFDSLA
jgi:aryl-alcohol dehydrogenase-like predicted oxidoreductase